MQISSRLKLLDETDDFKTNFFAVIDNKPQFEIVFTKRDSQLDININRIHILKTLIQTKQLYF